MHGFFRSTDRKPEGRPVARAPSARGMRSVNTPGGNHIMGTIPSHSNTWRQPHCYTMWHCQVVIAHLVHISWQLTVHCMGTIVNTGMTAGQGSQILPRQLLWCAMSSGDNVLMYPAVPFNNRHHPNVFHIQSCWFSRQSLVVQITYSAWRSDPSCALFLVIFFLWYFSVIIATPSACHWKWFKQTKCKSSVSKVSLVDNKTGLNQEIQQSKLTSPKISVTNFTKKRDIGGK
jgi:hypothetical protein